MAGNRIVSLGRDLDHPDVDTVQFRSSLSLLDYQFAIIDVAAALSEYQTQAFNPTYMGLASLDDDDSVGIVRDLARRRSEVLEMVQLGRHVAVITPPPTSCYVATGERQYSGTGRNRQATRIVTELSLLRAIPTKFSTRAARGSALEFVGPAAFASFWKRNRSSLLYRAVFDEVPGQPILEVTGTGKVAASFITDKGGGVLVFTPDIADRVRTTAVIRRVHREYVDGLIESLSELSGPRESLPEWTNEFLVPGERAAAAELQEVVGEVASLLIRRDEAQTRIERLRRIKFLTSGTGRQLEEAVRSAFETLGAVVEAVEPGRSDLRLTLRGVRVVVECKGKSGSAAEADAAQLEKWVAIEMETSGVAPKAVLVVNSHRDRSLSDRTEPAFPHQMVDYSTKRGHCLITGWQLLSAYREAVEDSGRVDEIVSEILSTEGLFVRYPDWHGGLEVPENARSGTAPKTKAAGRQRPTKTPA